MRDTPYATEIATASDAVGQSIERIFVKEYQREEIRFSWWSNGNLVIRPLDLPEEELLALMGLAIQRDVFTEDFLRGLQTMLNEHLGDGSTDA